MILDILTADAVRAMCNEDLMAWLHAVVEKMSDYPTAPLSDAYDIITDELERRLSSPCSRAELQNTGAQGKGQA